MKRSYIYRSLIIFFIIGFLALFFVLGAKNTTVESAVATVHYYVDIQYGTDDTAHGTSPLEGAWKTLHYAVEQINALGPSLYLLHVASGEYNGQSGEDNSKNIIIIQSNLTIRGEGPERPIVKGSGLWGTAFDITNRARQVIIDNLEISGFNSGSNVIAIKGRNAFIQNCYIHDNYATAISVSVKNRINENITIRKNLLDNNIKGIYLVPDPNDAINIQENEISNHDVGIYGETSSILTIERNNIHNNDTGIVTSGGIIKNNIIYRNQSMGIYADGETHIYHNTIDGEEIDGDIGIYFENATAKIDIKYNIITGFDIGIQNLDGLGNAALDYNNLWNNIALYDGVMPGSNDIFQDPLYNDPNNGNFTLQFSSPCIDAIPPVSPYPVTEDYNNISRPQGMGYDMGAYEASPIIDSFTGCTYNITPTSASFTYAGGGGSFTVTPSTGCCWESTTNDSWITITSGSTCGTVTVDYIVSANNGPARSGGITIVELGGDVSPPPSVGSHTVYQEAYIITYNVSASVSGGHGAVSPATQTVNYDGSASISITPDIGYHIATITDNGVSQTIANPYVIPNVKENHTVVVAFAINTYTVTASVSGGHGTVSPTTQTVNYEGSASISITPDIGYHIALITDNGISKPIANPYAITSVTENHTVVVTFALTYTVTASAPDGHGTVSPVTQTVNYGGRALISITPYPGYQIASITDNGVSQPPTASYIISNVKEDHTVIVTFTTSTFTVTASVSGGHGTVSPATQTVNSGGTASITITPDAGYSISSIIDNGVSQAIANPYSISNIIENHTVVVSFVTGYTVSASVSGGHGTVSPATQIVNSGGTASISITPDAGYSISSIIDNGVSQAIANPYIISNVKENHTVVVTFAGGAFTVSASVSGGHGTVSPATQIVNSGGTASISITPDAGYHIASITDNGVSQPITNPFVILNIKENHAVVVTFDVAGVQFTLNVQVSPAGGGSVSPSGGTFDSGTIVTLTAIPSAGYLFDHWEGDLSGSANPASITMDGNKSVTAVFVKRYTLTFSKIGNGTIISSPPGINCGEGCFAFPTGTRVISYFQPGTGSQVSNVIVDGISIGEVSTLTFREMTGDHNIEVIFN